MTAGRTFQATGSIVIPAEAKRRAGIVSRVNLPADPGSASGRPG